MTLCRNGYGICLFMDKRLIDRVMVSMACCRCEIANQIIAQKSAGSRPQYSQSQAWLLLMDWHQFGARTSANNRECVVRSVYIRSAPAYCWVLSSVMLYVNAIENHFGSSWYMTEIISDNCIEWQPSTLKINLTYRTFSIMLNRLLMCVAKLYIYY